MIVICFGKKNFTSVNNIVEKHFMSHVRQTRIENVDNLFEA